MNWPSIVIALASTLSAVFLADAFLSIRFRFPGGSLAGAPFAYVKGWKCWRKTGRLIHGNV